MEGGGVLERASVIEVAFLGKKGLLITNSAR